MIEAGKPGSILMPRQLHDHTVLDRTESVSHPGIFHEIRLGADGITYCTCQRWTFNQGRLSCIHIDNYLLRQSSWQLKPIRQPINRGNIHVGDLLECTTPGCRPLLVVVESISTAGITGPELIDESLGQVRTCEHSVMVKWAHVLRIIAQGR